jgi:uncharacterized protein
MQNIPTQKLVVFLKAPRSGFVKTRMAETVGAEAAAAAYRCIVDRLIQNLSSVGNVELRFAPDDALDEVAHWLRQGWEGRPQGSGDLGDRIHRAFAESFAEGAERVVVIGSDCPVVNVEDVETAWKKLGIYDVVIGPATDGGYWLIGLRTNRGALFQGIKWSTERVLTDTLERVAEAKLTCSLMRKLTDIDTENDWRQFIEEQKKLSPKGS